MKVLFLGAGASIAAGYPSTADLRRMLEYHAAESPADDVRRAWEDFELFTKKVTSPLSRILNSPNLEVTISILDLLIATRDCEGQEWWNLLGSYGQEGGAEISARLSDPPWNNEPKEFEGAQAARRGLLRCLDDFLWWKHVQDQPAPATRRREHLAHSLEDLEPGDVVITTNWDTLVERVLLERADWTPTDGYGFHVDLKLETGEAPPGGLLQPSANKVLKLHGSFGWYRSSECEVYLSSARLFQHLPITYEGRTVICRDRAEPPMSLPTDLGSAILHPTYLKQLEGRHMQQIWSGAADALQAASEFHAIGYSLPPSDIAVRVLLNVLRERHENQKVRIVVDNPDEEARHRWRELLGQDITTRNRRLGTPTRLTCASHGEESSEN